MSTETTIKEIEALKEEVARLLELDTFTRKNFKKLRYYNGLKALSEEMRILKKEVTGHDQFSNTTLQEMEK